MSAVLGVCVLLASARAQVITTVAGSNRLFPTPVAPLQAPLGTVADVAVDEEGNLYAADSTYNIVVRITPGGVLDVVAGNGKSGFSGDGAAATAASITPRAIAVDAAGNLYIADVNRIRLVSDGVITTVAGTGVPGFAGDGGPATAAKLNYPIGLAVDSAGTIYIADLFNNRVRKVSRGIISTAAGTGTPGFSGDGGPASQAELSAPQGVAVDASGDLYIADSENNRIRKVSNGIITTVAGRGDRGITANPDGLRATNIALNGTRGVTVSASGDLYLTEAGLLATCGDCKEFESHRVLKVSNGVVITAAGGLSPGFSGDGGAAGEAKLAFPFGLATHLDDLYIADVVNFRVRKVSKGIISTVVGAGPISYDGDLATAAHLYGPLSVAVDSSGDMYIADDESERIRKVSDGIITTLAGTGAPGFSGDGGAADAARLLLPSSVVVDSAGNLYIADAFNHRVRKISNGTITTVAGTGVPGFSGDEGPANRAELFLPRSVAVDSVGDLYIADTLNHRVRKVSNGTITTVAGTGVPGFSDDGGPANQSALAAPGGVAVDSAGNLYIADSATNRIRKVSRGIITTVAGTGVAGDSGDGRPATQAQLSLPVGVTVDAAGDLYIADSENHRIRKVSRGIITTVAGTGVPGASGDGGLAARALLNEPQTVTVDSDGNLYIADVSNSLVRKVLSQAPSFTASPDAITCSADAGRPPDTTQTISAFPSIAGVAFTATADAEWLRVEPQAGAMPATPQVICDPAGLAPGTYHANIFIDAPNAAPHRVPVQVTFEVNSSAPPKLSVSTSRLDFSTVQDSDSLTNRVQVENSGGGALAFTVSTSTNTGGSWLSGSPGKGLVAPSEPASITVTAKVGTLDPGTYTGTLRIAAAEDVQIIPVTLSVSPSKAVILLSQSGMTFEALSPGGMPLPQAFSILNTGEGMLHWSAAASTLSGGDWLHISPTSGTVNRPYLDTSPVEVSVNGDGLDPGDYYGRIEVTGSAANSPQSVTVILTVIAAGPEAGPELQPSGLIFTGVAGVNPGSQDVLIGNRKGLQDSYVSGQIGSGFSFLPTSGTVETDRPTTLRVYPDFEKLAPGTIQRGTITLQFSDGTARTIRVLSVVAPNGASNAEAGPRSAGQCPGNLEIQPTTLTDPSSTVTRLRPVTLAVKVVDHCGNVITGPGAGVAAGFSNGDGQVDLVHVGEGNWRGSWVPDSEASQVTITFEAFEVAADRETIKSARRAVTVGLRSGALTPVTVVALNAASGEGTFISPGGLVSIYGQQLAEGAVVNDSPALPTELGGTRVLMAGKPLPLRYVGTGQVNAQVPFNLGINTQQQLIVERGTARSIPQQVVVAAAQPAIYTQDLSGTGPGVIVNASRGNEVVTAANPAAPGDTLVIYCNGLGAVDPAVESGTPAPELGPLSWTVNPVTVSIGGVETAAAFSGLAPGFPDLYQVNVTIPSGVEMGDEVPVVLQIAGQSSPPVTLAVR